MVIAYGVATDEQFYGILVHGLVGGNCSSHPTAELFYAAFIESLIALTLS